MGEIKKRGGHDYKPAVVRGYREHVQLTDDELTTLARALGHAIRQLAEDQPSIDWDY